MKIEITVIKFELIDGKKTGKSLSLLLDPKELAHEAHTESELRKCVEKRVAQSGVFRPSDLPSLTYHMNTLTEAWRQELPAVEAEEQPLTIESHYDLQRFVEAQLTDYDTALEELQAGRKRSHWIWYIFPQQKGLGHSYRSQYYGLDGEDEARAYLAHPVLGPRLRECCQALLQHRSSDIGLIMGSAVDELKLKTCMDLFNSIAPDDIFLQVLDAFF